MSISFDRAASYYDETRGFPQGEEQAAVALYVRAGNLTHISRVLEIGVGTGRIALPLSVHVGAYYGVDISGAMMERLRSKPGGDAVRLIQGDATRLPASTGSFDAVTAAHIFHLISDVPAALNEVARVLRPEGMLLHGWNHGSRDALQAVWNRAIRHDEERVRRKTLLLDHGWLPAGEEQIHRYNVWRAPQEFVDSAKARIWSSCWRMSDAELDDAVEQVQRYIDANFADPRQPIEQETSFSVQAYLPPGRM